jgi:hypothetical protein
MDINLAVLTLAPRKRTKVTNKIHFFISGKRLFRKTAIQREGECI